MATEIPMPDRLERFLADVEPDLKATVVSYRPISGGYSRITALADIRAADGGEQKLIVRSDPPGGEGVFQSERDREWDLLQALWDDHTIEIPRPRWYDASGDVLGSKTIIMDHVTGTPLQLTLGPDADLARARTIFLGVADQLRNTPLDAMPQVMERPADWDSYIDSAIDIYAKAEQELTDSSPIIRYVSAWLRANKPQPVPLSVVHGDFQPGNILVADEHPPVVIDWEFTRIGDPREDVGYYSGSPLPNSMYTADPEAFLAEYRELTGFTEEQVNPQVMEYFFILGMAELYVQMMKGADGLSRGQGKGIMTTFLINSLCYFQERYLDICSR